MNKKNIAIIPARSGSKGLPDKNVKLLNGKPLIAYTIEAAIKSGCFEKVIVSTDSQNYAQIAEKYGAEIPFLRSEQNSQDTSSSWDVCIEVLEKIEEKFDTVVLLQPTSPLRKDFHIKKSLNLFYENKAEAVVSATKTDHPIEWCSHLPEDLSLENFIKKENKHKRRQELPPSYRLNGAIYIMKAKSLKSQMDLYTKNCYAYIMEEKYSIDIDHEIDFLMAETILKYETANATHP